MRPTQNLKPVTLTNDVDQASAFTDERACQVWANVLNHFAAGSRPFDGPFGVRRNGDAFIIEHVSRDGLRFFARD